MNSKMVLPPKEAAKFIASQAEHVKIIEGNIERLGEVLIEEIQSGRLAAKNFSQTDLHPKSDNPAALDWLLVVDTLNFCFWHNENGEGWSVDGHTGYFALCAAIKRALNEKVDILNPNFYSVITEDQLRKVLRSDTKVDCPLMSERIKCLHEVGNILLEKFDGTFKNVVKKAENSAVKLLHLIVENFQCFRDEAEYKSKRCGIYKRAQILVGDVWACFDNKDLGFFTDIDELSAFADYRIPQTLLWYGVFKYSDELYKKLQKRTILINGEQDEVEIRGCSLHAVELLNQYVTEKLGKGKINSVLIDHFLWDFRRKHAKEVLQKGLPFHKTFSIYY